MTKALAFTFPRIFTGYVMMRIEGKP